jgi:hypothetical protein
MERNQVLQEFLSIRILLNQANKLANEVTDYDFEIEQLLGSEYRLLFIIFGQFEKYIIEVCRRDSNGHWERSGFTKFKRFENFCANNFNEWEKINRTSDKSELSLANKDLITMTQLLKDKFDRLLKDY